MLAILAAMAITIGLVLALQGGDDGQTDDSSDASPLRWRSTAGVVHPGLPLPDSPQRAPTPTPAPAATPIPGPTDGREPPGATSTPAPAAASPAEAIAAPEAEWREPEPQPEPAGAVDVWITFYTCPPYCGNPAGPLPLGEGQAACDPAYMGHRFALNGREYICNDTGNAVWGAHVDLFFWDAAAGYAYLAQHGTTGSLTWR